MDYRYFVSYWTTLGQGAGFGNDTVTLSFELKQDEQFRYLEKALKEKRGVDSVIILNFQLLS